ncbi:MULTISPECIES: hypothetical protein [unclassified Paenibacillus]|uniref:hypothetical protein n=1 Tax=unclassified Paenibacillus TaxID=185978 RepID=UPI000CFB1DA1|nr:MULTISPECIES: hypothetical protein [unclassified Paenibacillus]PRA03742.1 hypothetical protein CQ043_19735 [Paenibacillus sp. MYb63]PRA47162.1 hypothetical protein CQ061_18005 [Paenibacillus sp. MYb67]QZN76909.1 hypothetical protein K5K90_06595 [Paenibacillus sp. DR312]
MKKEIGVLMLSCIVFLSGCGGSGNPASVMQGSGESPSKQVTTQQNNEYCSLERTSLDSETEKYFYGTWNVEKLLGFANSYNDASEYPTGQKFIGDEIIIKKDLFSSKGIKNYSRYQTELRNPLYEFTATCNNSDSFYRLYKLDIPNLNKNDVVKAIGVSNPSTKISIPVSLSFFVVNNEKLILLSEATIFELKKISDKIN